MTYNKKLDELTNKLTKLRDELFKQASEVTSAGFLIQTEDPILYRAGIPGLEAPETTWTLYLAAGKEFRGGIFGPIMKEPESGFDAPEDVYVAVGDEGFDTFTKLEDAVEILVRGTLPSDNYHAVNALRGRALKPRELKRAIADSASLIHNLEAEIEDIDF